VFDPGSAGRGPMSTLTDHRPRRPNQRHQRVAAITGAQKLLVGALVANTATDGGYITLDDMIQNVITPLKSNFGSQLVVS
jgi:hypothetical protein